MLVGDMLDAMTGFQEAENDRIKSLASVVRAATTKLWNTQIVADDRLTEQELWPFPWEKKVAAQPGEVNAEELKKNAEAQADYLIKHFPDGTGNNKS